MAGRDLDILEDHLPRAVRRGHAPWSPVRFLLWLLLGGWMLWRVAEDLPQIHDFGYWIRVPEWLAAVALAGCALLLLTFWLASRGRLRFVSHAADNRHLEAFLVFLIALTLATRLAYKWEPVFRAAAPLLALVWMWRRGGFRRALRDGWGLHAGAGVLREVAWGLAGFLLVWCSHKVLVLWAGDASDAGLWIEWDAEWLLIVLGAVIWAPFVEETFFRGAFHSEARRSCGPVVSVVVVATAFTLYHPLYSWFRVGDLAVGGVVLGFLREWRGSLLAPIVLHMAFNGWWVARIVFDLPGYLG